MASLSIGAVKGWTYGSGFEGMRPHLPRLSLVNDVAAGLQMLQLGRLDLFAGNERNTTPVLEALRLEGALLPVTRIWTCCAATLPSRATPRAKRSGAVMTHSSNSCCAKVNLRAWPSAGVSACLSESAASTS